MKKLMAAALVAAVACGCVTVNKNDGGESNMRVKIVKDVLHEKYTVGETTVSASDEIQCLFGFICWGSSATHIADTTDEIIPVGMIPKAKNGAYANACDAAGCDQLVGTRYKVTTTDYFFYTTCKAEVTGYPAKVSAVEVLPPCAAPCKDKCPPTGCPLK